LNAQIRPIKPDEIPLLEDFLYEAIYQPDESNLIPRSVLSKPEVRVFIDGFGKKDDHCLVAVADKKIVGAVWARILSGDIKGFGNIDAETPEFAISVYKPHRGKGLGTRLMLGMLALLKEKGYAKASLAVQKDNYAVKMYQKTGFVIIDESDEEYIMIHEF